MPLIDDAKFIHPPNVGWVVKHDFRHVANFPLHVLILEATYPIKKHYHWHPPSTTTTAPTVATTVTSTTLFHPHSPPPPSNHHYHQQQHHQFVTSEWQEAEMVGNDAIQKSRWFPKKREMLEVSAGCRLKSVSKVTCTRFPWPEGVRIHAT